MKKENELTPAIDSTSVSEKVVSVETSLLKSNAFKEELYAIDKAYEGLLNSIKNFGLKEPLIVDGNTHEVISGNRRLKAVLELGYEHIPVIFRNPGDADREILYISHENQREKTYSQYLNEFKIIQSRYPSIKKLNPDSTPLSYSMETLASNIGLSRTTLFYLLEIDRMACAKYKSGRSSESYKNIWIKLDSGITTPKATYDSLKPKSKENKKVKKKTDSTFQFDTCKYLNKSCEDLTDLKDKSVASFVSSPPYWGYKKKYGNEEATGLGTEKKSEDYINNLVQIYKNAVSKLKDGGSIWVNLTEPFVGGEYHLVPHRFAMDMKKIGLVVNDCIVWSKNNSQFTPGKRSIKNYEFLFQFIRKEDKKDFYYDSSWIENASDYYNQISYSGGEEKKLKGHIDFRDGVLKTNITNIEKLKSICSKLKIECDNDSTFPIELGMIPVLSTSKEDDLIVDLFGGVGTMALVAGALNRKSISYEINPEYCKAAKVRLTELISIWETNVNYGSETLIEKLVNDFDDAVAA